MRAARGLLGPLPTGFLGKDDHRLGHAHRIEQAACLQGPAKRPRGPIARIGHHDPTGPAFRKGLVQQLQGNLAFGQLPAFLGGHPGPIQPGGVG
jgi:hypothetical protein